MPEILIYHSQSQKQSCVQNVIRSQVDWSGRTYDNQDDLLHAIHNGQSNLIIAELVLADANNAEFIRAIHEQHPHIPTLLIGDKGTVDQVLYGLQLGATGFIHDNRIENELVENIKRILAASQKDKSQARLLECMSASRTTFVLENDPQLLPTLLGRLQTSLTMFGICDEASRTRLGIALEEALSNALYHGNLEVSSQLRQQSLNLFFDTASERREQTPYSERRIHVIEDINTQRAVFTIRDQGPGFDTSRVIDPAPKDLEAVSGRGIMLIKAFMDEVRYNAAGNEVTLVKYKDTCPLALAA